MKKESIERIYQKISELEMEAEEHGYIHSYINMY